MTLISSATVTASATPPTASGWVLSACTGGAVFTGPYSGGGATFPSPETYPGSALYPNGLPAGGPLDALLPVIASTTDQAEMSAAHYGLGNSKPTVISDTVSGHDGSFTVQTLEDTTYTNFVALLTSQATLWLSNPFGLGLYVRAGLAPGSTANITGGTGMPSAVHKATLDPNTGAARVRVTTVQYVEQDRP